jgi:hypothetical protein
MKRLFEPLLWFFLAPYFFVGGLNVRPWFGGSRQSANRTNAQLALSLILIWPLIFAVPRTGWLAEHPKVVGLLILPALWFVSAWMKGGREQRYLAAYRSMPRRRKIAFGLSTATFMVVPLVLVSSNARDTQKHEPQTEIVCDPTAAEVNAETCSVTVGNEAV